MSPASGRPRRAPLSIRLPGAAFAGIQALRGKNAFRAAGNAGQDGGGDEPGAPLTETTLPAARSTRDGHKPLIVLADDDGHILDRLSRWLGKRGFEVARAIDGHQALELVRTLRPSAAVLDWAMPGLHGYEVCDILKQDPATADVPIIMMSPRMTAEIEIAKGFARGADEFLTRPLAMDDLVRTLRRHIRPSPARDGST